MRRLPIVPTFLVALAAAAMVALGGWQLDRRQEKLALLRDLAANPARPAIAFPDPPVGDGLLFRHATATCLKPGGFHTEGAGKAGFRVLARCATAGGAGFAIQLGTTRDLQFRPAWTGGAVSGTIGHVPSHVSLLGRLLGNTPPAELMLIADRPAPGLAANDAPSIDSVPNNHLAYAVQWFAFAGIAVVIYLLALRRRQREG